MAQNVTSLDGPQASVDAMEPVETQAITMKAAALPAWLDRPLASFIAVSWETAVWVAIFILGIATRFYMLGTRAMSHDESLHALYSYYLYANGNFDHNPMMHGPFLFHANALAYFLFGDSDATARLVPALFGIGVIWMIYLLRPHIGRTGAIVAAVLVALSPSLLFHSRYIRNDIYIAFDTLVWIYGAFRYLDLRRMRYLVIMVIGMALGFMTKEVQFMHGAIIGAFFAGLAIWQIIGTSTLFVAAPLLFGGGFWYLFHEYAKNDLIGMIGLAVAGAISLALLVLFLRGKWSGLRRSAPADLAVIMLTMALPFLAPFVFIFTGGDAAIFMNIADYTSQELIIRLAMMVGVCVLGSAGIAVLWFGNRHDGDEEGDGRWRPQLVHWALLMGLFWLIQVVFFTTFFTNTVNGLASGVVGSLGYWLAQQAVKRGNQPVYYYVLLGWLYEFLPAILSIGGIATVVYNLSRPFARVTGWDPVVAADLAPPRGEEERALQAAAPEHLRSNRLIFVLFGIWWTAASWIAYTVAGEKMPWLLVHIALPMCVFGGWWLGYALRRIDWRAAWEKHTWLLAFAAPALMILALIMLVVLSNPGSDPAAGRVLQWLLILGSFGAVIFYGTFWVVQAGFQEGMRLLAVGLAGLLFLLTVRTTVTLNYINYDMATEYLVYAHGGPDIKRALDEIDTISQRTVGERNIVVAYDDDSAWPFSWYMRLYPNAKFYGNNPTPDAMSAPVVIVGPENRPKVEPYMARDYIKRTYRRMWWPEMDYFDLTWDRVWGAIVDPAQRQRIFDIIAFRKYRNPDNLATFRDLAHWPYQGEFDMYVRRDLAAQIWDLAVLPVSQETPDIPVLGPEQLRIVTASQIYTGDYGGLPLVSPRAVAIGPAGERVIADSGNHRIVILDRDGNYLRSFGSFCNVNDPQNTPCTDPDGASGPAVVGDGQFYEPWGVVVDPQGALYVADTWNGRIQVFDLEGNLLRKWGIFATTNAELGDPNALFGPRGLAIDLDGNLLVADTGNKRILKFTPGGELIKQIGGGGVIAGRFEEPTDVTVDPTDGSYLVADSWNGRVQRFSADMDYLGEFLVPGWSGREVSQKPFLTVLADGAIYATDPATALIIVFNRDGSVRAAFGGSGVDANRVGLANGIAADLSAAAVVVADAGNNRVMVFPEVKE